MYYHDFQSLAIAHNVVYSTYTYLSRKDEVLNGLLTLTCNCRFRVSIKLVNL